MVRMIKPLDNTSDFEKLNDSLFDFFDNDESFKYLSYSLKKFDKETIKSITKKHKDNGIDYLVYEKEEKFFGIFAYKRTMFHGFELYLLVVNNNYRNSGIGQNLIEECVNIASKENYKCIDTYVFADNKNMLRLLIKNDFLPIEIQHHSRADGTDLVKLRKYI